MMHFVHKLIEKWCEIVRFRHFRPILGDFGRFWAKSVRIVTIVGRSWAEGRLKIVTIFDF
jgi:hypothetical protein